MSEDLCFVGCGIECFVMQYSELRAMFDKLSSTCSNMEDVQLLSRLFLVFYKESKDDERLVGPGCLITDRFWLHGCLSPGFISLIEMSGSNDVALATGSSCTFMFQFPYNICFLSNLCSSDWLIAMLI